jgi:hypothetical protein
MSSTFGDQPGDVVTSSRGDVLNGVSLSLYPSSADATAGTNLLTSVTTNLLGRWSYTHATLAVVWARTLDGQVYAVEDPTAPSAADAAAASALIATEHDTERAYQSATYVSVTEAPLTPYKFGAIAPVGTADNTTALAAMFAQAAGAITPGEVYLPPGNWNYAGPAIAPWSGMKLRGAGRNKTKLIPKAGITGGALFAWSTAVSGVSVEDMWIDGVAPGVHIFSPGATGGIDAGVFKNLFINQELDNARIWNQDGSGSFIHMTFEDCELQRTVGSTLAPFYVRTTAGAANGNAFRQVRANGLNNVLTPFFYFESSLAQTYLTDWEFDGIVGEQNPGGLLHMIAPNGVTVIAASDEDATTPYVADVFRFDKNALSLAPRDITMIGCARRGSSLSGGVNDIYIDSTGKGSTLIACNPTPVSVPSVISVPADTTLLSMRNAINNASTKIGTPLTLRGYASVSRPAASGYEAGATLWDTTLNRWLASDATNWLDPINAAIVNDNATPAPLSPSGATYTTASRNGYNGVVAAPASGMLYLSAIALPAGFSVGNISFSSGPQAAVTPTHWWFGLYDQNRVQLATTADQTTAAWALNTVKTLPVAQVAAGAAASFTTTYAGVYYIGLMMTAATVASFVSSQVMAQLNNLPPIMAGSSTTGQTTPPAFPFTAAAITTGNVQPYGYIGA